MSGKRHNYIRSFRKRANLTQRELAFLLGAQSNRKVSEYELHKRDPQLSSAFALQVVFRVPAHELFSGMYAMVEQPILERAQILLAKIQQGNQPSMNTTHKEAFLAAVVAKEQAHQRNEVWENKTNMRFYLP